MAEITGVKQVLAQTQALERVQEGARRQGEQQQQSFASSLGRQVDRREHQVNAGEGAPPEDLEPDAKKKESGPGEKDRRQEDEAADPGEEPEQDDRGRHIDVRA